MARRMRPVVLGTYSTVLVGSTGGFCVTLTVRPLIDGELHEYLPVDGTSVEEVHVHRNALREFHSRWPGVHVTFKDPLAGGMQALFAPVPD